ncbi:MAG: hypothetical protein KJ749_02600 [Planctomycetes bacterium]|nr:hypothetical protein [Planctomycetota bacterium]
MARYTEAVNALNGGTIERYRAFKAVRARPRDLIRVAVTAAELRGRELIQVGCLPDSGQLTCYTE